MALIAALQSPYNPLSGATGVQAFDVASIRPSKPDTPQNVEMLPGGLLIARRISVRELMVYSVEVRKANRSLG